MDVLTPKDHLVVQHAWQQYTAGASLDVRHLSPEIASSWQRCQNLNVDPLSSGTSEIDHYELKERLHQYQHLVKVARPVMERLYELIKGTGFQIVLSDETGYLLDAIGDVDIMSRTQAVQLCPGGNWSEPLKGTNAIGTAIFERKPVQVFAAEHYCQANHFLVCSAAPIFSAEGRMAGVLDLSGDYHASNAHTLGMVAAAAGAIENQLRLQYVTEKLCTAYRYSNILLNNMSDGLLSVDHRGIITELNLKGASIFGVDPKLVKGRHVTQLANCQIPMLQLLNDGTGYEDREIDCNRAGKKIRSSASLLRDENGSIIGAVAIFRELDRSKAAPRQHALSGNRSTFDDIVGQSASMIELKRQAKLAAGSSSTILLEGESGTGKELVAQAIHHEGQRCEGPFIAVNCAALPESLIESELFGYEEGSFTGARKGGQRGKFEMADGGTLFLDEIGDMPLSAQIKLLRVIQERKLARIGSSVEHPIDIRIIAATLRNLKAEVKAGRFRQDLYYRLNVLSLRIPPLRERREDIAALALHLVEKISQRLKIKPKQFDDGVLEMLQLYSWPGNVRELENVIERAINLADEDALLRAEYFNLGELKRELAESSAADEMLIRPLHEIEKEMICKAVAFHKGKIHKAAISLGISRNTLYRKMKEYEIGHSAEEAAAAEPVHEAR
jgi:sigma-54 dependent transcriptional regulator, acetoin dehydrogenase operon transcriptional activator AcoR